MAPKKSGKPRKRMFRKKMRKTIKKNTNRVGGPNTATVTYTTQDLLDQNTYYTIVQPGLDVDPANDNRVINVAKNYALYRISKVVVKFTPKFDTYVPGATIPGANPVEVPYLYWTMNRFGDVYGGPVFDAEYFIQQGAKPLRFDDKNLTVSFRPNILLGNIANGGVGPQIKMTPWLSTDQAVENGAWLQSSVDHYGITFGVAGAASGNATGPCGYFTITVYYQFKNPLVNLGVGETQQSTVQQVKHKGGYKIITLDSSGNRITNSKYTAPSNEPLVV